MGSDYVFAWSCYIASSITLIVVLWHLLIWFGLKETQNLICALAAVFLFTPVPVTTDSSYWAPAFMAAVIDLVASGTEAALNRIWPLLIVMFVVVLLTITWRIYQSKQNLTASSNN
ncbi:MAG: hypothetical protein ACJA0N_002064 [Pseudohongiellaceae bacterium]|jgi:hypothetical protein